MFFDVARFEEAEGEEFFLSVLFGFFLPVFPFFAGGEGGDLGAEDAEDGIKTWRCRGGVKRPPTGRVRVRSAL